MRIDVIEHAANEGPGKIALWAQARGYTLNHARMDAGAPLPSLDDSGLIVIMGGGMNIYEHRDFPFRVVTDPIWPKTVARLTTKASSRISRANRPVLVRLRQFG